MLYFAVLARACSACACRLLLRPAPACRFCSPAVLALLFAVLAFRAALAALTILQLLLPRVYFCISDRSVLRRDVFTGQSGANAI